MDVDLLNDRELDAAIARDLFGQKTEPRTNARTGELDYVSEVHPGQWVVVAYYLRSMGPCLNVIGELRKRGWEQASPEGPAVGNMRVEFRHVDGRTVETFGPICTAICRVALKALGAPGPGQSVIP